MPQQDRTGCRPQDRMTVGGKTVKDLQFGQLREVLAHRLVQRALPALEKLHGGHGRDRLGHGSDAKEGLRRDRCAGCGVASAKCAVVESAVRAGHHGGTRGDAPALDGGADY